MTEPSVREGGCHCGRVRFQITTGLDRILACNCSICAKQGLWLTFVKGADFKLLSGAGDLEDYQFGRKAIHHMFCTGCGVESFGRGTDKDGSETFAVNVRCLDGIDVSSLTPTPFDGKSL